MLQLKCWDRLKKQDFLWYVRYVLLQQALKVIGGLIIMELKKRLGNKLLTLKLVAKVVKQQFNVMYLMYF